MTLLGCFVTYTVVVTERRRWGLRYKPWACMWIVLLVPIARKECVSVWEWVYGVCMVNMSPSGRRTDWCSVQLSFSVLRIYKSDWYRNMALVFHTSSYLGLVEFYLKAVYIFRYPYVRIKCWAFGIFELFVCMVLTKMMNKLYKVWSLLIALMPFVMVLSLTCSLVSTQMCGILDLQVYLCSLCTKH